MATESQATTTSGGPTSVEQRPRPRIHVEGVTKHFGGRAVVNVEDLMLGDHPIEGLIGPNGAGKTTLMRMIMHSISLDDGTVTFLPADREGPRVLSDMPAHAIPRLGVVKSNQVTQDFDRLTIWDSLLLSVAEPSDERPWQIHREKSLFDEHEDEIRYYLDYFGFEDPSRFARSTGERKLLDIVRCLLLRPRLLLLDEPTAGLPEDLTDLVMDLVKERARTENISVVIVEHDLRVIWDVTDYVHFMAEGEVMLQGDPAWIRSHETVAEKYLGGGHV